MKLTLMCVLVACSAFELVAMPTKDELTKAEPTVRKLLELEQASLKSGKKTRSEVADTTMKFAEVADTEAAKLLLMKGAFTFYVHDGKFEEAVETMNSLKAAIPDMPAQSITNIIKTALQGMPKKECARFYQSLNGTQGDVVSKVVAGKLRSCDFLANRRFKRDAKVYLCLFSASWCPPCRAEMPRIAKTYAETLLSDPDIELIHFSRDRDENKAKAWAKEHNVRFPVVKPNGGNPLNLYTRGIPHLFIVRADGTLMDEGHPMKLFTDARIRELKQSLSSNVAVAPAVGNQMRKEAQHSDSARTTTKGASIVTPEHYGIRMLPASGCEKGAEYVLEKLRTIYLPRAVRYYGDPFEGVKSPREYEIKVERNGEGDCSKYSGPSYRPGTGSWLIGLAKGRDTYEMSLDYLAASVLTVCRDANWGSFVFYVNRLIEGEAKGQDPIPQLKKDIQRGLAKDGDERDKWYRAHAPLWAALEELREKHPDFIQKYCVLKNRRFAEGRLPQQISLEQMASILGEVTGENVAEIFGKYGVEDVRARRSSK